MVKLELTSEADLFFHYSKVETIESFDKLKQDQQLTLEFEGFIGLLIKLLNFLQSNSKKHFAILQLFSDGRAKLDFLQNLHYKFVDLLTFELSSSDDDSIRESITYRYNIIKAKMMYLQSNFKQFSSIVKTKNPGLILQLEKTLKKNGQKTSNFQNSILKTSTTKSFRKYK